MRQGGWGLSEGSSISYRVDGTYKERKAGLGRWPITNEKVNRKTERQRERENSSINIR